MPQSAASLPMEDDNHLRCQLHCCHQCCRTLLLGWELVVALPLLALADLGGCEVAGAAVVVVGCCLLSLLLLIWTEEDWIVVLVAIGGSVVMVIVIVAVSVNCDPRSCNCCDDDIVVVAVCREVFSFVSFRLFFVATSAVEAAFVVGKALLFLAELVVLAVAAF